MQAFRFRLMMYWLSALILTNTPLLPAQILPVTQPASAPVARLRNAPRIAAQIDRSTLVQLAGHTVHWVTPANEAGAVAAGTILHLDFTLSRAPAVQAEFEQRLQDQQNPTSPYFHVWLTPAQIGDQYGPNPADINQITDWLTQQGFRVDEITPSRQFIRVSAPVTVVKSVLRTSFRMYTLANGKTYRAAIADPSVPSTFAAVLTGIAGLNEAPEEPLSHMVVVPGQAVTGTDPQFTSASTGNHYITPGDFAILYDVAPVYAGGIDGTGQKVAIIGRSQVNPADITNYEASVGLPSKLPNVVIPPLGLDPGLGSGDQGEATLDVQRVIGTAPGAQADLVISSNAGGGLRTAIQYNVQTLLDPIMTISFGACEAYAGQANVNLYTQLFSQAAAEGISVFVSSGDSGAAGCDTHSVAPPTTTQIASINYICSSGFATCVGGTEFNDFANPATYWSSTNTANRTSALTPIPEGVWNQPTSASLPFFIAAGGGGVSTYTVKPVFQNGLGVPADGFRDTPDMSFSAAGHDPYFGCYAQPNGGNCVVDPTTHFFSYVGFSGTSAAAPSMAGVAALLNQKLGAAQGNVNTLLYRLAATSPNVYNDATIATSGVSGCTATVPSICNNSTPSATALTGGLAGYLLTTGYDLATGWGSIDVGRFLSAAVATGLPTSTTLTGTSGNTPIAQNLNFVATVQTGTGSGAGNKVPTGAVQFFANGALLGSANLVTSSGVSAASYAAANTLPLGPYLITAVYAGDSNFDTSNSAALSLTEIPGGTTASSITLSANPSTVTTAQTTRFFFVVTGTAGGPIPTGMVTLATIIAGYPSTIYTGILQGGQAAIYFAFGKGTDVLVATYGGDLVYLPATSKTVTIVSNSAQPVITLTGPATLTSTALPTLTAVITGLPPFTSFASVKFLDGTTLLGTTTLTRTPSASGTATLTTSAPLSVGTHTVTAMFTGDTNTLPATSAPLTITVVGPGLTLAPAAATLSLAAGSTTGNTDGLTLTSTGGFAGAVSLACTIAYSGTGTPNLLPTCGFSAPSVTLTPGGTATSTMTLTTTLPHTATASLAVPQSTTGGRGQQTMTLAFALLIAYLPWTRRRVRWHRVERLLLLVLTTGLLAFVGCGHTATTPTPVVPPVGTTSGMYTVSITANGGASVSPQSTTVALTVQ